MVNLPSTMRSLVAPRKCTPASYEIQQLPTRKITHPEHVLIKVHAVGMFAGDTRISNNELPMFYSPPYPFPLGQEGSGTVIEIGPEVKNLKVGDEVYGLDVEKPMFREAPTGFVSDYTVVKEKLLLRKPSHVSFEDASSLVGSTTTAHQVIRRGLQRMGWESLEGKTVYVPAGLSTTGSIAIQVAKNVYGASKIITTVSTKKLELVERYLPGMVDVVVDYTTENLTDRVKRGSVDLMINTLSLANLKAGIPLVDPKKGAVMGIFGIPSRATVQEMLGDRMAWWLGPALDIAQWYQKWLFWGTNIQWEFVSGNPSIREDLEKSGEWIATGKVKAVQTTVKLSDLEGVKRGCEMIRTGKGGLGKLVITMDEER